MRTAPIPRALRRVGLIGLLLGPPLPAQPSLSEWTVSSEFEVVAREERQVVKGAGERDGPELGDPDSYLLRPPGRRGGRELVVFIEGLSSGGGGSCRGVRARFEVSFHEARSRPVREASMARAAASVGTPAVDPLAPGEPEELSFEDTIDVTAPAEARTIRPEVLASLDGPGLRLTLRRLDIDEELPRISQTLLERFMDSAEVRGHLSCLALDPRDADGGEYLPAVVTRGRIQHAVAQALPRSFDSALESAYGFSAARRHVDLEPGMRLCLYSLESLSRQRKTMFRQGARQCVSVGWGYDDGDITTEFEPLLARFENLRIGLSGQGLRQVTDGVDLSDRTSSRRFYRIFFPRALERANVAFPVPGAKPPLLVGVDSATALDCATAVGYDELDAFCAGSLGDPPVSHTAEDCEARPICYQFGEQAVPIPEILIELGHEAVWVPLGTTLLDVLARTGIPEIFEFSAIDGGSVTHERARALLRHIKLERRFDHHRREVEFSGVGSGALHIPLFQGDKIQW